MKEDLDFLNIYEEFFPKILHYLKRKVGGNDAEDKTQDLKNMTVVYLDYVNESFEEKKTHLQD